MEDLFIPKIVVGNFQIGSFDIYKDYSRKLIMKNSSLSAQNVLKIIDSMPEEYRASIRLELNSLLIGEKDKDSILTCYKTWLRDSLNLSIIEEVTFVNSGRKLVESISFSPPVISCSLSPFLVPGISRSVFEQFLEQGYDISDLQFSFSIKYKNKLIAIIGLSDIVWSNECATLNLFLNKDLEEGSFDCTLSDAINHYLEYVHCLNIHNISCRIPFYHTQLLQIISSSNMRYYGQIPFSSLSEDNAFSTMLFQHIPGMLHDEEWRIPDCPSCKASLFQTNKNTLADVLRLNGDYLLVSPMAFDRCEVDIHSVLYNHILTMLDREHFTKVLGKDKYILQALDGDYPLLDSLMCSTYILLDNHKNYHGFVNILSTHANHLNAEIEMGLDFLSQYNGLDTIVLSKVYEEMFAASYASITTSIYSLNTNFIHLNNQLSNLVGIQLESYYMDGQLWNKHYYTKINDLIYPDLDQDNKCIKKIL